LIADIPAAQSTSEGAVLFAGHADTVWPLGTLASDVPWVRDGGIARGPGAFDMKAGLVVMIHALRAATSAGLKRPVRMVIVGDEEIGSPSGRVLIEQAADGCSAALGFESPYSDGVFKVGRFGVARVEVDVTGVASHAALDPESGISATDELVDQLLRVRGIVDTAPSSPLGDVLQNLGAVHSDARTNVIAASACARIGLRFPTTAQQEIVFDALRALEPVRPGARVDIRIASSRPAWTAKEDDMLLAHSLRPDGPSARPAAGAADTNALGSLPIPVIDGLGPSGGGAHARDEHVVLADMDDRIDLLTRWLTA
jgi:glutamate carboxypeptidase